MAQDRRFGWTLKSKRMTTEDVALFNAAARKTGSTAMEWALDTLREAAKTVLKGDGASREATPPARPDDIADMLAHRIEERLRTDLSARLAALEAKIESSGESSSNRTVFVQRPLTLQERVAFRRLRARG